MDLDSPPDTIGQSPKIMSLQKDLDVEIYDHQFVCLNNDLIPQDTNPSVLMTQKGVGPLSATIMINQKSHLLPEVARPYTQQISSIFNWSGYKARNKDLAHLSPYGLVEHFLLHGIHEPRHWNTRATLLDRRFAWLIHSSSDVHLRMKMQVVVHCYHYRVLCQQTHYLKCLSRLGATIILLVANKLIADSAINDYLASLDTGSTRHTWIRVENFGEDWSSFHRAFKLGIFDEDGITFKLQTKLSNNLGADGGCTWIDEALGPLCSNFKSITDTLHFLSKPDILIAASSAIKGHGFGANIGLVKDFIQRVGLPLLNEFEYAPFAAGSMFVTKNSFARSFYAKLGEVDHSIRYASNSAYCGKYAGHAIERVFFYYAQFANAAYFPGSVSWIT